LFDKIKGKKERKNVNFEKGCVFQERKRKTTSDM
jgi:hypothetical protein